MYMYVTLNVILHSISVYYSPNQKHQVEQFLLKIMFSVIQEASHLPDQLLDTVLVPLIEPHKVREEN